MRLLSLALALNGFCGVAQAQLAGDEWRTVEIGGVQIPSNARVTIRFSDAGKVEGFGGCNRFFGAYTLAGDRLQVGQLGATRMACPEPVMSNEARFLNALEDTRRYVREGINLTLYDQIGKLVVRFTQNGTD